MYQINTVFKKIKATAIISSALFISLILFSYKTSLKKEQLLPPAKKPNILFVISDDQSYPHTSAYGFKAINTPAFDRIAKEGALFTNAIVASPGCSPSRAAILTGRNCWQLEEAGTHASGFSKKYITYPDLLEEAGYFVGFTGKGWGPGDWSKSGRSRNPAGTDFNKIKLNNNPPGIASNDYAANFSDFLSQREKDQPFCFWFGAFEPHRFFSEGKGLKSGKKLEDVVVPSFLPDKPEVRSDILDYCMEIEWFDTQLAKVISMLEKSGELDNTIIVVTSDNGMAFPRAKANTYEFGIHVPLAIRWGNNIKAGTRINNVVSLIDIAPTILEAAGVIHPGNKPGNYPIEGISMLSVLTNKKRAAKDTLRTGVYSSRERHSFARWNNFSYPQRALRTNEFLYIRNFKPELFPAGDPQKLEKDSTTGEMKLGAPHSGYNDIDASPTLDFLVKNRDDKSVSEYFHLAVDKRPAEELYNIKKDPSCLNNLAKNPAFQKTRNELKKRMDSYLRKTNDPRIMGKGDIFETYPRYEGVSRDYPPHSNSIQQK